MQWSNCDGGLFFLDTTVELPGADELTKFGWNLGKIFADGMGEAAGALVSSQMAYDMIVKMLLYCKVLPMAGNEHLQKMMELRNQFLGHAKGLLEVDAASLNRVYGVVREIIVDIKAAVSAYPFAEFGCKVTLERLCADQLGKIGAMESGCLKPTSTKDAEAEFTALCKETDDMVSLIVKALQPSPTAASAAPASAIVEPTTSSPGEPTTAAAIEPTTVAATTAAASEPVSPGSSPSVGPHSDSAVLSWTVSDVAVWVRALDNGACAKYADAFVEEEVTGTALVQLTIDDLKEMGVKMGPRKVIATAIVSLRNGTLDE